MSSLESNKVIAGVLVAGLLAMATGKVAEALRHPGELEENAYPIAVSDAGPATAEPKGPPPVEPVLPLLASADPAAGEAVAKKCAACHSFDQGGPNKLGPALWGVVGRPKASHEGFNYSDALASFDDPKDWTYTSLNKFLHKPKQYISGTAMNYAGLSKVKDRANLIAYLRSLSDSPAPLPTEEEIAEAEAAFEAASGG